MEYGPFDPDIHADPDEHLAALRDHCPVHHHAARDFYTVSRTDDITMILRTPELWSSRFRNGVAYRPPPPSRGCSMLIIWQRRLLQKAWTPSLIDRLQGRIQMIPQDSKTMLLFAAVNRDPEFRGDPTRSGSTETPTPCDAITASVTGSTSVWVPHWRASRDESSFGRSSNGCRACATSAVPTVWKP